MSTRTPHVKHAAYLTGCHMARWGSLFHANYAGAITPSHSYEHRRNVYVQGTGRASGKPPTRCYITSICPPAARAQHMRTRRGLKRRFLRGVKYQVENPKWHNDPSVFSLLFFWKKYKYPKVVWPGDAISRPRLNGVEYSGGSRQS